MNYQSLYDYCRDISQSLGVSVKWVHTDNPDFALANPDQPITCLSLPFMSNGNSVNSVLPETYVLKFIFYQQDKADGSMDQNDQSKQQDTIQTLSSTWDVADRFIRLFNSNSINDDMERASEMLTINSYSKNPAIRDTSFQLTGTVLEMSVGFPDNFNYCCLKGV